MTVCTGSDAPNIGPQLPPGIILQSSNYAEDSEGEAGPSLSAPEAASVHNKREAGAAEETMSEEGRAAKEGGDAKRRAGPALPAGVDLEKIAAQAAKVDWEQVEREEEEEEEDLVGPAMPGPPSMPFSQLDWLVGSSVRDAVPPDMRMSHFQGRLRGDTWQRAWQRSSAPSAT
jgi:hypothetical protein